MITLNEAAELLGLDPSTLRRQAERGTLRARKLGNIWTVSEREVERYRAEHLGKRGQWKCKICSGPCERPDRHWRAR